MIREQPSNLFTSGGPPRPPLRGLMAGGRTLPSARGAGTLRRPPAPGALRAPHAGRRIATLYDTVQ